MCVIHQPSSQVYHIFDRVLLLVEGRTAFLGDIKDAQSHFEKSVESSPFHKQ
jgi:ABC-type multidrug transport system ATPase subunit